MYKRTNKARGKTNKQYHINYSFRGTLLDERQMDGTGNIDISIQSYSHVLTKPEFRRIIGFIEDELVKDLNVDVAKMEVNITNIITYGTI